MRHSLHHRIGPRLRSRNARAPRPESAVHLEPFRARDRAEAEQDELPSGQRRSDSWILNDSFRDSLAVRPPPLDFFLLKPQKARPKFYDFDQFQWLVEAAGKVDPRIQLVALLGGEAGLRRGEIIALEWPDVDLRRGLLTIERSEWKGEVTPTKGMKVRVVPLTQRLQKALAANRHMRGDRVLYTDEGETVTAKVLQRWMAKAQRRAGLCATGTMHLLRHTFCSHLAMRGAPALSIQRLAGHEHLQTTLGYVHLAQGETERAIRLFDHPRRRDGPTEFGASQRQPSGNAKLRSRPVRHGTRTPAPNPKRERRRRSARQLHRPHG